VPAVFMAGREPQRSGSLAVRTYHPTARRGGPEQPGGTARSRLASERQAIGHAMRAPTRQYASEFVKSQWGGEDSNLRPADYESARA
jgi:hypothetical protein